MLAPGRTPLASATCDRIDGRRAHRFPALCRLCRLCRIDRGFKAGSRSQSSRKTQRSLCLGNDIKMSVIKHIDTNN